MADFDERDRAFMRLALDEARAAAAAGDFPVGAALVVDGELWGVARNSLFTDATTTAHAEHNLLMAHSAALRRHVRENGEYEATLYTTLEPCLMCLGITVMHRFTRIVVACPDPFGGTAGLDPKLMTGFYQAHWPQIDIGLFREESRRLVVEYARLETILSWREVLEAFEGL